MKILRAVTILALVGSLGLASCGGDEDPGQQPGGKPQVTGVVTAVDSETLGDVRGFTVKDGDESYEFLIDPDVEYGFPLDHLQSHLSSSEPVKVFYDKRADGLYALRIDDA